MDCYFLLRCSFLTTFVWLDVHGVKSEIYCWYWPADFRWSVVPMRPRTGWQLQCSRAIWTKRSRWHMRSRQALFGSTATMSSVHRLLSVDTKSRASEENCENFSLITCCFSLQNVRLHFSAEDGIKEYCEIKTVICYLYTGCTFLPTSFAIIVCFRWQWRFQKRTLRSCYLGISHEYDH